MIRWWARCSLAGTGSWATGPATWPASQTRRPDRSVDPPRSRPTCRRGRGSPGRHFPDQFGPENSTSQEILPWLHPLASEPPTMSLQVNLRGDSGQWSMSSNWIPPNLVASSCLPIKFKSQTSQFANYLSIGKTCQTTHQTPMGISNSTISVFMARKPFGNRSPCSR